MAIIELFEKRIRSFGSIVKDYCTKFKIGRMVIPADLELCTTFFSDINEFMSEVSFSQSMEFFNLK